MAMDLILYGSSTVVVLRFVKAGTGFGGLSHICGDAYRNYATSGIYRNVSKEIFGKLVNDLRLDMNYYEIGIEPTSGEPIRYINGSSLEFIKSIIEEYIKKDKLEGSDKVASQEISEKSTIDELKKFRKECEDMMKTCIYEQLGDIFIKERIDYFYDIMQKKSDHQNDMFRDYICAMCDGSQCTSVGTSGKNSEFNLRTCAQKYARIIIEENYNAIVNYVSNEISPSYADEDEGW